MFKALIVSLQLSLGAVACIVANPILAQVTRDDTVNTQVNQNGNVVEITGGEARGGNLFHSFQDFSVPTGNEAFFNNAASVLNIFSRVTGGNISNIDGAIRANDSANLFLFNPAGIIFGANARLDIGGSFYGSTASSILFEEGEFSAVDNLSQPTLTINAPIGLGFRDNPGDIINRSNFDLTTTVLDSGINPVFEGNEFTIFDAVGLEVNSGASIALVGGNVTLENAGSITAPGGNIELGGLSKAGEILINQDGSLTFPEEVERGNVSLTQQARVKVASDGGGSININARNLELIEQSELYAGIAEGMGSAEAQAGDVTVNTTESVRIVGSGGIGENTSNPQNAFVLIFNDYDTAIRNVVGFRPNEEDMGLTNLGRNPEPNSSAIGNAGSITIETDSLEIEERGSLTAKVYGQGNTGDVNLQTSNIFISRADILNQVISGTGNTGNIDITTDNLTIEGSPIGSPETAGDSSFILADTRSVGESGNINITALNEININNVSLIQTQVLPGGEGDAGDINIDAENFNATGGRIQSGSVGIGNAGDININVQNDIVFDTATLSSQLAPAAIGSGGNINIAASNLDVNKNSVIPRNSQIVASTQGQGNAGNITFAVDNAITISDSLIVAQAEESAVGNAGNITITTGDLNLSNNSELRNVSLTRGNAGNITVNTSGNIVLDSSEFRSDAIALEDDASVSAGSAGTIDINAQEIILTNNSSFQVDSQGGERGGTIFIESSSLNLSNQGVISAITTSGEGGNISLKVDDTVTLDSNSLISSRASNEANGGNIDIDTGFLIVFSDGNNDILASAEEGQGGNITIDAESLFGIEERFPSNTTNDIDASSQFNLDGNVRINTPDLNPVQGAIELPTNVVELEEIAARACGVNQERSAKSGFTIQGKGGIPPAPSSALNSLNVRISNEPHSTSTITVPIETTQGKVKPARGVKITESGEIILTAYRANSVGERIPEGSRSCG